MGKGRRSRIWQVDHHIGEKPVVEFSMNAREEITSQISGILEGSPSWEARVRGTTAEPQLMVRCQQVSLLSKNRSNQSLDFSEALTRM